MKEHRIARKRTWTPWERAGDLAIGTYTLIGLIALGWSHAQQRYDVMWIVTCALVPLWIAVMFFGRSRLESGAFCTAAGLACLILPALWSAYVSPVWLGLAGVACLMVGLVLLAPWLWARVKPR
jgi:RsiW-degrading membrane proteinase PrsW (M82 family)